MPSIDIIYRFQPILEPQECIRVKYFPPIDTFVNGQDVSSLNLYKVKGIDSLVVLPEIDNETYFKNKWSADRKRLKLAIRLPEYRISSWEPGALKLLVKGEKRETSFRDLLEIGFSEDEILVHRLDQADWTDGKGSFRCEKHATEAHFVSCKTQQDSAHFCEICADYMKDK